jgi:hypothetical protein
MSTRNNIAPNDRERAIREAAPAIGGDLAAASPRAGDFREPSALSLLDFGVDRLQFAAGVVDFHLPVDAALSGIDVERPGGGFAL